MIRVFGSIWKYRMQWFSWRPEARTPKRVQGLVPWEVCKIELSKMQFPAFPGPELGNLEGLLRC